MLASACAFVFGVLLICARDEEEKRLGLHGATLDATARMAAASAAPNSVAALVPSLPPNTRIVNAAEPELEVVLDLKNDGIIAIALRDGRAVVTAFDAKLAERIPIEPGQFIISVNGKAVERMTYSEVHSDVYKNELGLVALRFRRPPAEGLTPFTGGQIATRLGEPPSPAHICPSLLPPRPERDAGGAASAAVPSAPPTPSAAAADAAAPPPSKKARVEPV
jgi:hypothetical protein